jgi:hypothetical protein
MGDASVINLILSGTSNLASWVIENHVLPSIREKGVPQLHFRLQSVEQLTASLVPLPDGSAFARNASSIWSTLEPYEAREEVQYIGFRFAPSDRWKSGFAASLQAADGSLSALAPMELASAWEKATGSLPHGFKEGILDRVEAFGFDIADKLFHTQGRLGL